MLTRSKIVIDVDPFIHAETFRIQLMQPKLQAVPTSPVKTTALIISGPGPLAHHAAPQRVQMVTASA
jgi:hypothetical protein